MPDPKRNFEAFAASLEKSGFKVNAQTGPWRPDYVKRVNEGSAGHLNLIGWTGDYGHPDNFLGTFFQKGSPQFGFQNRTITRLLDRAEAEIDTKKRDALYRQANKVIMDFLPGVPYVHTEPSIAFTSNVQGYIPSPVNKEDFAKVSFAG